MVQRVLAQFRSPSRGRRIYLRDLLDYKRRRDSARHNAIIDMARAEMEAGTYDKVVLPEGAEDE